MKNNLTEQSQAVKFLVIVASFVVIVAGMKAAESIIVPFFLALFITIIVSPPYFWLQEKGLPKAFAMLIVIFAFIFIISVIGLLIGTSIQDFTSKLPLYETKLRSQVEDVIAWLTVTGILKEQINLAEMFDPSSVFEIVANTLNELSGVLANGFLILLMIIFMLLEVSSIPVKIKKMFNDPENSIKRVNSISDNINKYIAIKTVISIVTGFLVTIFLLIMGVDYPVLWGVLAFALNFIPTIGSIIALIPAVLLTIVQLGFGDALIVLIGYLVINTIMGNILEPRLMGKGLGLSTLVVFISLIFWGWVLGPVGMLLSVPLTITIKIILDSSEETRWFAVLLGPEKTD